MPQRKNRTHSKILEKIRDLFPVSGYYRSPLRPLHAKNSISFTGFRASESSFMFDARFIHS
uniref:Uncharacterized protein n=2 Tax=Picea TaxID=3328 RepID=A0A101M1B9_PICGL|nr:hypothetical protein ABT39_MTgene3646 [Picea glauca]QHR89818.1 hypothetical protein Q903MT_gene3840 [Picea sitchensis]